MPGRVLFSVTASLIVIAVVGCGGGSDSKASDPSGPRAVAVAWSKALDARDGEKACSLMTPASVKSVERSLPPLRVPLPVGQNGQVRRKQISAGHPARPCAKEMSHGLGPTLPAGSTSINGHRAVVQMKERDQLMHRVVLFRVDGNWRVDFDRTWDHPFGTD